MPPLVPKKKGGESTLALLLWHIFYIYQIDTVWVGRKILEKALKPFYPLPFYPFFIHRTVLWVRLLVVWRFLWQRSLGVSVL